MHLFGVIVTGIGTMFLFLGNLGILRLPDVYNRVQAGTKCTTLGAFLTIIGVGIMQPAWFWKALLIAVFILVTNPISSHAIARASRKSGVRRKDDFCFSFSAFDAYSSNCRLYF
jgi:multicomponent Na+:H+ antiporter subunit G